MRTNLVLNEDLLREAMQYSNAKTKRALVEEALRTYVEVHAAAKRRRTYADRVRDLEAKLEGLRLRERPSEILRSDRNRP